MMVQVARHGSAVEPQPNRAKKVSRKDAKVAKKNSPEKQNSNGLLYLVHASKVADEASDLEVASAGIPLYINDRFRVLANLRRITSRLQSEPED